MQGVDDYLERIRADVDEEIDNELYGPPRTIPEGDCLLCARDRREREKAGALWEPGTGREG